MNPPETKTRGVVIVTRVSTGEQDRHGTSPETQLDMCRTKAAALGVPIVAEYYDAGISGAFLASRGGMQQALADIREGRADTLICPNMSRYSRDTEHQQRIKREVRACGGRVAFCDMDFDDTPAGDLAFGIFGSFAEYERKVIRERCISGHQRRAEAGIQTSRVTAPFGYVIPKNADVLRGEYPAESLGKYIIVEPQATIVRGLFTDYGAGTHSLADLARRLNRDAIPTPGGGRCWQVSTLQYLLRNPVYKGLASYGRFDHGTDESRLVENSPRTGRPCLTPKFMRRADPETWITWRVPALVSEEDWDAVQRRMEENRRLRGGNPQHVRMLSGRVFCPHCGAGMTCVSPGTKTRADGQPSQPRHRYICQGYRGSLKNTGHPACAPTAYAILEVEAAVLTALLDAAERPASVEEALKAHARQSTKAGSRPDVRAELAALDAALKALEVRQQATVQSQIAGVIAGADAGAYSAVFADIAAQRKDLEDRRGRLSRMLAATAGARRTGTQGRPDFAALLEKARQVLTSPDVSGETKRQIVGAVIERVICRREGRDVGAEIQFLPGVFAGDTLQTSRKVRPADRHRDL